jgi:TP901 family phage tail tape measure protein
MTKEIEARLKVSAVDKTGQVFQALAGKMDQVNRRAEALNRQQGMMARGSQAAFGTLLRFAAPAALAYGAKAALVDFAALDRQMTRIGNTAGSTSEETKAAFVTMQQESKQLAMPLNEAVTALDTLVSSGMSLKEAMDFLPSVLATTQASGAAVEDIANTGLKASSALKISAGQMQHAFDLMVASGQSGQFELKDMAVYIPSLANSFARIGYKGEDGLKRLMAALQTVREDTGTAEEAANDIANVFQKMGSRETISNFKKFGINLSQEMDKAKKKGEDTIDAFIRLSNKAVKGDLTKLPLLFSDKQVLEGMTSLITSTDRLTHYYTVLSDTGIDGTVARNNIRVLNDTQASVDRLSNSYEKLKVTAGGAISKFAVPAMDAVSKSIDYNTAVQNGSEKSGKGFWSMEQWGEPFREYAASMGIQSARQSQDQRAYRGGYRDPEWLKSYWAANSTESSGPMLAADRSRSPQNISNRGRDVGGLSQAMAAGMPGPLPGESAVKSFFRVPSKSEFQDALKIDLKPSADEASRSIADGGKQAGDSIKESAALMKVAGVDIGAAIAEAAAKLAEAAKAFGASAAIAATGGAAGPRVNADRGRSMSPSVTGSPQGGGGW